MPSETRTSERSFINNTFTASSSSNKESTGGSSRNTGLVRIWVAMQNTLCGFSTVDVDGISKLSRDIGIGMYYSRSIKSLLYLIFY